MITKLWRMLFPLGPEKLLTDTAFRGMDQLNVALSSRAYESFLPNVYLELKGRETLLVAFGVHGKEGRWDVWQSAHWSGGRFGRASEKMFAPLWLYTHLSVKESFEPYKQRALEPVSGQTTEGLHKESQGLEWLKTSFRVLQGALESCQRNSGQVVVGNIAMSADRFSIQCFNLDISVVFRSEGYMSVIVFDDKNLGSGSVKNPSLTADFATLKPAVLDEFIKLAALILKTAESRYSQF